MTKTLLVMMNYTSPFDIKTISGSGNILWQGKNGFEWIGSDDEEWNDVYIIQYSDSKIQSAIENFKNAPFKQLKLLAINPFSSIKIKSLQYIMRFFLSIIPFKLSSDENFDVEQLLGTLKSPILPSSKQFSRLFKENQEKKPVAMLNLLKYNSTAIYPLDFNDKKEKSGEEAYNKYGKHVMRVVAKLGGYIIHMGKVEGLIIGEKDNSWDEYAIMRYPNRVVLRTMLSLKDRGKANLKIHRDAGLEKTKVIALNTEI